MDLLRHLVFENPLTLWMTLGLACLVAALIWSRTGSRRALWTLGALLAAMVAVGIAAWAVETDRERVERTLRIMAKAADTGDAEALIERISPEYRNGPFRQEDLAKAVRAGLRAVRATAATPIIRMEEGRASPRRSEASPWRSRATVTQAYVFRAAPGKQFLLPPGQERITWEGTFGPDEDGEWRLRSAIGIRPRRITAEEAAARLPQGP